jgi:S-methylmethionine-dependent homocysteine/selenocysteine methylase
MSTSNDKTLSEINNIVIFDGGTGREIERCGGPFRQPEWSALALYEDPSVVQRVHESFLEAGATAITTNTYAIVPFHIGEERYQKDGKRLLKLAIQLAQQGRDSYLQTFPQKQIQILGSIPPICGSYEPDKFDETFCDPILQDFLQAFGESDIQSPSVDVLLLETVGSLREAAFYLTQIRNHFYNTALPIWLSFCVKSDYGFDKVPTLLSGEGLSDSIQALFREGLLQNVQVILINCCDLRLVKQSIQEIRSAIQNLKKNQANDTTLLFAQHIRIGAYPNAFSIPPPDAANHTLRQVDYNISPPILKGQAEEWMQCGATVMGGCCGVNPDHIRAMASLVTCPPALEQEEIDKDL